MNLAEEVLRLKKIVNDLEKKKSIEDIILKSEFVVLGFFGLADGNANLSKSFDDSIFNSKKVLIKSLRIVPYYSANSIDMLFSDGTSETIVAGTRINRVFDSYTGAVASYLRLLINSKSEIFKTTSAAVVNLLPSDFEMDNIYALYEQVSTMNILCYFEDSGADNSPTNPNVKVYIECYIF